MVKEVDWQTKLIEQIKRENGYGKKWATQWAVGVPDLILSIKDWGLVTTEVKLEKGWNKDTVRTIQFTTKQKEHAAKIVRADGICFGTVVVYNNPRDVAICPVPMSHPRKKLCVRLSELLKTSYHWQTGIHHIGGVEGTSSLTLGEFFRLAYNLTIETKSV